MIGGRKGEIDIPATSVDVLRCNNTSNALSINNFQKCDSYISGCTEDFKIDSELVTVMQWNIKCQLENVKQKVSQDSAPCYGSGEGGEAGEESVKLQPRGAFYPSGTVQPPEQCLLGPPVHFTTVKFRTKRAMYLKQTLCQAHSVLQFRVLIAPCSVYRWWTQFSFEGASEVAID